jgi:hypothetical protein
MTPSLLATSTAAPAPSLLCAAAPQRSWLCAGLLLDQHRQQRRLTGILQEQYTRAAEGYARWQLAESMLFSCYATIPSSTWISQVLQQSIINQSINYTFF